MCRVSRGKKANGRDIATGAFTSAAAGVFVSLGSARIDRLTLVLCEVYWIDRSNVRFIRVIKTISQVSSWMNSSMCPSSSSRSPS
jgi:hypothetical protein